MPVTPVRSHRLFEPRLIGPQVRPDHLEARLECRRVDAHALDRPGRGALAAADLRALEGRSGGARAGEQPAAVAEHDLRVGADVHQQRELIGQVRALGEDDTGGIRADVAGDARQGVDACAGIEVQGDLARLEAQGFIGREREGRAAELDRIDAEHEVVHDRVADDGHLEEVGYRDLGLARHVSGEAIEGATHRLGHLLRAPRVHHRVRDAAHQILAEADLRVHEAAGGDDLTGFQVAQVSGDGGGADIDREPVDVLVQARPDGDDLLAAVHRGGDLPGPLAQGGLQGAQDRDLAGEPGELPFALERLHEPLQVAGGIVHVRFAHFHVVQAHHRIERDGVRLGGLAHHLAMHLTARAARR